MHLKSVKLFLCLSLLFASLTGFASESETATTSRTLDTKLSPPLKSPASNPATPFEKQFRTDTGASAETLHTVFVQALPLGAMHAKNRLIFKFDLSDWPENLRSQARLWIAIGAPAKISTAGTLNLTFSQNGCSMSTELNNNYNVDGIMILGSDYLLKDGEVTVEIENGAHLTDVTYTLHAVVYVPPKL